MLITATTLTSTKKKKRTTSRFVIFFNFNSLLVIDRSIFLSIYYVCLFWLLLLKCLRFSFGLYYLTQCCLFEFVWLKLLVCYCCATNVQQNFFDHIFFASDGAKCVRKPQPGQWWHFFSCPVTATDKSISFLRPHSFKLKCKNVARYLFWRYP